jgi:C-terminal processing protease CtpA/Prc
MGIRSALLLGLALLSPMPAPAAPAASDSRQESTEQVRLERLAALARVWGQVRYAHPAFATRELDWDRALLDAIPRVDAARDGAQFRAAMAAMLATLDDPATRVLDAPGASAAPKAAAGEAIVRGADGVVRVDFARIGTLAAEGGSVAVRNQQVDALVAALAGAKGMVLDTRSQSDPTEDWASAEVLQGFLAKALPGTLRMGSLRYRSYSGYPPQTNDSTSGGYVAGLLTELPTELAGAGKSAPPPLVFVTNANSAVPATTLAGLQAAGLARVVAEDGAVPVGGVRRLALREGLVVQVRVADVLAPDGVLGVSADYRSTPREVEATIVQALRAAAQPRAPRQAVQSALPLPDRDRAYAGSGLPSRELRLLALFRFWNIFERFFPYRPLIGPGWDDVLQRYIPQFEANRDLADYELTLRKLAAESHDSHVGARSPMDASAERLGRHQPPVLLRFVEGRTIVAALVAENTGLQVGDVVERIDGEPVEARRAFIGQYYSASTPQAWQRNLHRNLLRGQAGSSLRLEVRGLDGKVRTAELKRSLGPEDTRLYEVETKARPQPVFGVLASGLGYVDLARLTPAQVDDMFEAIAATPGTIFDMRGYPNGTAWSIAPRLGTRDAPVGALFRRTLYETDDPEQGLSSLEFEQRVPPAGGATRYRGKVVMLINEFAQSQSEHTGLFFEAATDVTFIGTPTAGANGDITYLVLPGGYSFTFSGHDVRHADGRQLQRLGLQPDVPVAPTIAGLARGDDEVLAAAERWLLEHPKP